MLFAVGATARWARDGITANALMPGGIATNLQRHQRPGYIEQRAERAAGSRRPSRARRRRSCSRPPRTLEGVGGRYYEDCAEAQVVERRGEMGSGGVAPYALDADNADRLWELSERLLGAHAGLSAAFTPGVMAAARPGRDHRLPMSCIFKLHRRSDPRPGRADRLRVGDDALRRLVTIPISHYCEKARWALERAGLDYIEERHVQGVHQFASRRAGGHGTLPVLVTAEGAFAESEWIVRYADAHLPPEQRLFTGDPEVEALCRWLDGGLGPDAPAPDLRAHAPAQGADAAVQQPGRPGLGGARADRALPASPRAGRSRELQIDARSRTTARASSPPSTRSPSASPTAAATCPATASRPPT